MWYDTPYEQKYFNFIGSECKHQLSIYLHKNVFQAVSKPAM